MHEFIQLDDSLYLCRCNQLVVSADRNKAMRRYALLHPCQPLSQVCMSREKHIIPARPARAETGSSKASVGGDSNLESDDSESISDAEVRAATTTTILLILLLHQTMPCWLQ